jgi:hypothetical protein
MTVLSLRVWPPTAAARVRSQVKSSGICGGQNGVGAGFLRVFRFSCQFSFHIHYLSSGADTIDQLVIDIPTGGLSLTAPQETKKKVV